MTIYSSYLELIRGEKKGIPARIARLLLWLASLLYAIVSWFRNRLFNWGWRAEEMVDVPVISVGNITAGGTGKTPLVAWLARWLQQQGLKPALVSRGYGARRGEANDEALELEQLLPGIPHFQNPDRAAAARRAVAESDCRVILLDDAFQHRGIGRDLDIVLLDATEPFGSGYLLPRGLLRESPGGLRRASLVGISRSDQVSDDSLQKTLDTVRRLAPGIPVFRLRHAPQELLSTSGNTAPLSTLHGNPVLAISGIANPGAFHDSIQQAGMQLTANRQFPDHHQFSRDDIDQLESWVRSQPEARALICTGKDLVRLQLDQIADLPLWAMTIEMEVTEGLPALEAYLETIVLMTEG